MARLTMMLFRRKAVGCFVFIALNVIPSLGTNVSVSLGGTASLKCRVDQVTLDPSIMVVWSNPKEETLSLNGNIINSVDPRLKIERPNQYEFNLHISNAKKSDQGRYLCKALKNGTPFYNSHVVLMVLSPPQVRTTNEKNTTVSEGGEVVLECLAEGEPRPALGWKFHRRNTRVEETIEMVDPTRFAIKNATLRQSGHYECQADNNVPPVASIHFYVQVLSAPRIHVPYMKVVQKTDLSVFLHCIVTWNPSGTFHWEFEGQKINFREGVDRSEKYSHSKQNIDSYVWSFGLFVSDFGISDGGHYKCHASNDRGATHAIIEVAAYQEISDEFTEHQTVRSFLGRDVVLECRSKDAKHPATWLKHTIAAKDYEVVPITTVTPSGKSVVIPKYQLVGGVNLKISSVNELDSGYYMCSSKFNSTVYLTTINMDASTAPSKKCISFTTVLIIGGAVFIILCCSFLIIFFIFRRKYISRLNISEESALTGLNSAHKM